MTVDTYDRFFRSNRACHAEQNKRPDKQGKFGYCRYKTKDFSDLILDMYGGYDINDGLITPATYPFDEDGLTVQCAYDIDNHNGNNPALPRVNAIVDHIREIGGQPIVEASGSKDSYHIYMPILPASIETSHNFIKTCHHELKQAHKDLDFKGDTETFPKQKNKKTLFGNALKLPLAINNKTGKRSQILDPDTKEPVDVLIITRF